MSAGGTAVKVPNWRDVGENHSRAPGNTESVVWDYSKHHIVFISITGYHMLAFEFFFLHYFYYYCNVCGFFSF